jgi:hypothetical protein
VSSPLLEVVHGLLARTYRLCTGLRELGPFVIGDRGLRELYGHSPDAVAAGSGVEGGARTLVRETNDGVAACIYFPDAMIERLEAFPPQRGLGEENLIPFATFVEEIDHLLVLAERSLASRPVTLFELELHANVSKYLVLARFLAGREPRLDEGRRRWLRRSLFDAVRYRDEDLRDRERYREAARVAVRLLDGLRNLDPATSVHRLRRFHAADLPAKLRLVSGFPSSDPA